MLENLMCRPAHIDQYYIKYLCANYNKAQTYTQNQVEA